MPSQATEIQKFLSIVRKKIEKAIDDKTVLDCKSLLNCGRMNSIKNNIPCSTYHKSKGSCFDLNLWRHKNIDSFEILIKFYQYETLEIMIDEHFNLIYSLKFYAIKCDNTNLPKKGKVVKTTIIPIENFLKIKRGNDDIVEFWNCLDEGKKKIKAFVVKR